MPATLKNPKAKKFGERLDAVIDASGLNRQEFAEAIGISPTMLSRWTKGRVATIPRRSNLRNVAVLLNYDTAAMLAYLEKGTPLPTPIVPRRIIVPRGSMPAPLPQPAHDRERQKLDQIAELIGKIVEVLRPAEKPDGEKDAHHAPSPAIKPIEPADDEWRRRVG